MPESKLYSLGELAEFIGAAYEGDGAFIITGLASLPEAGEQDLAFYTNSRYQAKLAATRAGCVLLHEQHKSAFAGNKLIADDPYLAYARLSGLFFRTTLAPTIAIHPSAVIADTVSLGENVSIGPNVVIEPGVVVGAGAVIGANCFVGENSHIGANSILYPNVSLYNDVRIGDDCILHSSCVLGSDGFGFAPSPDGWQKIYQLGGVRLGDRVEIGAGTTVDRGALDDTVIEDGVKIDNQVQVAHNAHIGENTAIAAATAIAGSAVIGKRCTIAGGVGIVGHIEIADDVHVTAMTMITKSITESGSYSSGVPMNDTRVWKKNAARFNQLDDMARQLRSLKKSK